MKIYLGGQIMKIVIENSGDQMSSQSEKVTEEGKTYIKTIIIYNKSQLTIYTSEDGKKISQKGDLDLKFADETSIFRVYKIKKISKIISKFSGTQNNIL